MLVPVAARQVAILAAASAFYTRSMAQTVTESLEITLTAGQVLETVMPITLTEIISGLVETEVFSLSESFSAAAIPSPLPPPAANGAVADPSVVLVPTSPPIVGPAATSAPTMPGQVSDGGALVIPGTGTLDPSGQCACACPCPETAWRVASFSSTTATPVVIPTVPAVAPPGSSTPDIVKQILATATDPAYSLVYISMSAQASPSSTETPPPSKPPALAAQFQPASPTTTTSSAGPSATPADVSPTTTTSSPGAIMPFTVALFPAESSQSQAAPPANVMEISMSSFVRTFTLQSAVTVPLLGRDLQPTGSP